MNRLLFFLIFAAAMSPAQDQKAAEASDIANRLVDGIIHWSDKNTPGSRMEMHEISRGRKDDAVNVMYHIVVTGTPHNQAYALYYWPINEREPQVIVPELWITDDGSLCRAPDACKAPNSSSLLDLAFITAKGEPHR